MSEAIQAASRSMLSDLERLRSIGSNVANASTPGFKAERMVQRIFQNALSSVASTGAPAAQLQVLLDSKAGALRDTGRAMDLAIDGPGYFQIDAGDEVLFSRRGDFRVDAGGRLSNEQGLPVLGEGGEIVLTGGGADFEVDRQGYVSERGQRVGKLAIAQFGEGGSLAHVSGGLYRASEPPQVSEHSTVVQKHLEMANVDIVQESLNLVEVGRHANFVGQAIRGYDQMLDVAINELGRR